MEGADSGIMLRICAPVNLLEVDPPLRLIAPRPVVTDFPLKSISSKIEATDFCELEVVEEVVVVGAEAKIGAGEEAKGSDEGEAPKLSKPFDEAAAELDPPKLLKASVEEEGKEEDDEETGEEKASN